MGNTANLDFANNAAGGVGPVPTLAQLSFEKDLYLINGQNQAPLWALLNGMRRIVGGRPEHQWPEIKPMPERSTTAGSVMVGAVQIAINNPGIVSPKATLRFFNPQCMFWVSAINLTTGIATGQWIGTAPTVAIAPGTAFIVMAPAYEQANAPYMLPVTQEVWLRNYYQFPRHYLAMANMARQDHYQVPVGGLWRWRIQNLLEPLHKTEVEKSLMFGIGSFVGAGATPAGSPAGFMEGLYTRCVTNRTSLAGAALTRAALDNALTPVFRDRLSNKEGWTLFVSTRLHFQISQMFTLYELGTVSTESDQAGVSLTKYKHPTGAIISLVVDPLFDLMGRWDLGIGVKLTEKTAAIVNHYTHPTPVKYVEGKPPYELTYTYAGFESNLCPMFKDEEGTTLVIEDVGGNP